MSKKAPAKPQQVEQQLTQTKSPEAPVLLAKLYLSPDDLQKLDTMTPEHTEQYLAKLFSLDDYEFDLKTACLLDYYMTQYWWAAKQKQFNRDQIANYFTVAYLLFDSLKEKNSHLHENVELFKSILIELSEKVKVFNEEQMKEITTHLTLTFFQNQKLFEFVLNEPQSEVYMAKDIQVECPKPVETLYPPPLDEAIPEPIYNKYILKLPEPPSAEELARLEAERPEKIELTSEVIDEIRSRFGDLTIDDAKRIIYEVTNEVVSGLKNEMKTKIKERETTLINELSKSNQKRSIKK